MITRENFKEVFLNLVEIGKKEIDRTLPIVIKKYNNDYVATRLWGVLAEEFDKEWLKEEEDMYKFIDDNDFDSIKSSKFINDIKENYNLCENYFNCDIKDYFYEILQEYFKSKVRVEGWNGRIKIGSSWGRL